MNVLIVYHAPHCNDGYTAAWVTQNAMLKKKYTPYLYPMAYGEEEEQKLLDHLATAQYGKIYVVDFSLRLEVLNIIIAHFPDIEICVLDHHKSAFNMYAPDLEVEPMSILSEYMNGGKVYILLDNAQSGASLCWSYFNPEEVMPPLVLYVRDRDLWIFEYGNTRAMHMYLNQQEKSIFNWNVIDKELQHHHTYQKILSIGNKLLKEYNEEVAYLASFAVPCTIHGEVGLMTECGGKYASDVGQHLVETCGTFGLMYYESEDGNKVVCSLRSGEASGFDVEVLAKKFGGGGHKYAAGFVVDTETLEKAFDVKQSIPEGVDHHGV